MGQAIFAGERRAEKLNTGYENDRRLRWLFHPSKDTPCVFDIHTVAVDPQSPWVRVRRRVVPHNAAEAIDGMTLLTAMTVHPSMRINTGKANMQLGTYVVAFKEMEDLPRWVRERMVILNMADGNMRIPGIGKRWGSLALYPVDGEQFRHELPSTFYTLEFACENEEGP